MKRCLCLVIAMLFLAAPAFAASDYPRMPVKVIVPFAAGGSTDVIMRTLAKHLEKHLGQKIGVVNMEGASGSIGAMQVYQAKPDGYTLLFHQTSMLTAYHMGVGRFTWDELTPICNAADFDLILSVTSDAPWQNAKELLDDAKKRPGQIKFGVNMGAGAHFAAIALDLGADVKFHHVAAGGDAKRVTALLGKHVDVTHPGGGAIIQYVTAGKIRPLASFGAQRTPGLDDVPTLRELGYDAVMPFYNGFFGPPGLPQDIVEKFSEAVKKAVAEPEFVETLRKATMYPDFKAQEEYKQALIDLDASLYKAARAGNLIPSRVQK